MPEDTGTARQTAITALGRYWGHDAFRSGQWEAIEGLIAGEDVLAVLPTGGGKSLCYQLPALLGEGLVLVVSPLIALMQDQVAALKRRGIPAAFINSTLSARAIEQCWTDAEFGRYKLLYVAPERLQSELFLARGERLKVCLLAVDEAHCVSEWGHHFRPAYLKIAEARPLLGNPPVLAVTATATPEVRRDIVEQLQLRAPRIIVKGFDRPNITWSIFGQADKRERVRDVLKSVPGTGIIYTATRRDAETWAEWLGRSGETAAAYHGGMDALTRAAVQDRWLQDELRVVVATNAFGMGVDKPDVRFVIHAGLPGSLEMYYQEAGRAGRDGRKAYAVLLCNEEDEATQRALLNESHPDGGAVRAIYNAVANLAQIAVGSRPEAPVVCGFDAIARLTGYTPGTIRTGVELLERQGAWTVLPARKYLGHIRFLKSADVIRAYAAGQDNASLVTFVQNVLRAVHADAFSGWWEMDLRLVQKKVGLDRRRVLRGLAFLKERGLVDWYAPGDDLHVQFNEPRPSVVRVDDRAVRKALRRAEVRLDGMLRYARSATCRRRMLLSYFGEESGPACGNCDICLGRHETPVVTPEDEPFMRHILQQVRDGIPREDWFAGEKLPVPHQDALVDWLVREEYLRPALPHEARYGVTEKAINFMEQWVPRA